MDVGINAGSYELLDASIEKVRNNKNSLVSTMDSIRRLLREVELEEEAAEKATKEARWSSLDTLVKMDKRNQALAHAKETINMLVRKLNVEKDVLAIKMELLHCRVANMLDVGDRSLDTLSEMCKALKKRLTSAASKKDLANKKKLENESALAEQELQIKKVVEEFNRLKQVTLENSKLQGMLKDYDLLTQKLNGEITDCKYGS